ncbi:methyl-accepting chemotaxis protein [Parvularcula sp. LCG005]|uniref:methyl-accepting chemotaxis protein n=1 Tax=Parvularcula sp. LCG005 TaxID=3078805 RepID=UPI002942334E|nr:methyl-accepting chemotaxis protein [Parvularcula sp. LCG005]WOI53021.1 methyl-accepting chemotaxis protein [Parvularcula sp. LCG005]
MSLTPSSPAPRRFSISNFNTRPKVLFSAAVPLVLMLIIGAVAEINLAKMHRTQGWVDHTQKVLSKADAIVASAVDMETGLRGYLLAGEESFLDPYKSGANKAFGDLADLRATVSDNPPQVARLQEVEATLRQWQTELAEREIELRRRIGDPMPKQDMSATLETNDSADPVMGQLQTSNNVATMDDIVKLVAEGRGKVYFDEFRRLMSEFKSIEQELMVSRQAANNATREMTVVTIIAVLIFALVASLATAFVVGSDIGNSIKTLTGLMNRLADGDNTVVITGQDRRDEVGDMARATEVFKQNAIRVAKLNHEQEEASRKMAELAAEREKAAQREVELARQKEEDDRKAAEDREQMMRELGEAFGQVVEAAIDGEFSNRVDAKFTDQILNDLAGNINNLMGAVDRGLTVTGKVLEKVADGDLTQRMEGDFRGAFAVLQDNTNSMIESLKSLVGDITTSGGTLAGSSAELRDTANTLSRQAEQNAASLEETAAALEELSTSIKQVSGNVSNASQNAKTARDTAQSSGKIAADAAEAMTRISEASKEIAQVVSVINEIAFQINLLALNAGVEAARAGEAGNGFSVVAAEVRQLAQRASEAAKEIDGVINRSDDAVSEGVSKVSDAQASLFAIAESVVSISKGVDEISTAISQQVIGINEITTAVSQVDQNTQKQAAAFEEVTAASAVLANEAESLQQSTRRFSTGAQIAVMPSRKAPMASLAHAPRKAVAAGGGRPVADSSWDEF